MKQIKILLWFDVEDFITPESDDAFLKLLQMLDETGVRATIKFCTKKVERLKALGREDILRYLPSHELAFHSTAHSIHPLPTEYLDRMGFRDGTEEFIRREKPGFDRLCELVGQHPVSYGHPGMAWAPQAFAGARAMGVPTYLDAHPILNVDGRPFWYDGVFTMSGLANIFCSDHDPQQRQKMWSAFENMDMTGEDVVFFSIYDHPTDLCTTVFWDRINFAGGKNPEVYQSAPLRPPGELENNIAVLRDFIEMTLQRENVEYITATQAIGYEKVCAKPVRAQDLVAYATGFTGDVTFAKIAGRMFAPSEIFSFFAKYLTGRAMQPDLLYGPEQALPSEVRDEAFEAKALAEAAYEQFDSVRGFKQLRSLYRVGSSLLNPVDLFCMLSECVATGKETVPYRTGRLAAADYVNDGYDWSVWPIWEPGFQAKNVVACTKLQCWTLKPVLL
ncbi:MAG: hypothetical protein K5981_06975 [Clostridia bacterium]|nr:hypothetical protein [Clostridia bacterium]